MDINVTKRNGRVVPFKMKSIRNAIEWAMGDIKCLNSMELEASFCLKMKDGIETSKIQKALIESALSLCSNQDPEWKDVAGRLAMWDYKKNIEIVRGIHCYENYLNSVKYFTEKGVYSTELLDTYSEEELFEAGEWIVDDRDKLFDYAGTTQVTKKYLLANELPQEMFLSVALLIASVEPEPIRFNIAKQIYDSISQLKLSLASPILGNMRTHRASGSSCFILSMNDSLVSIMDNVKNASLISQKGGGIGINFSKLRGNGATINKRKNAAKGVIPFMKVINDTMVAVNQG